jgi:AraC-like DNA-binding protein
MMKPSVASFGRDLVRDIETFRPFSPLPGVPDAQLDDWLSALKITFVSALEWWWGPKWVIGPRVVSDSMFFWVEHGSGTAWIGTPENTFTFQSGDLILIPKGVEHCVENTTAAESHVYAVHFFATLFSGVDILRMIGFPSCLPGRSNAPYRSACKQMVRDFAVKPPGWMAETEHNLFLILLYMIRNDSKSFTPMASSDFQADLPRLLPVFNWIDEHLASNDLTVAELASQIFVSETHFRRLFHKVIGISPVQFVRRRRIENACHLLRTSDQPVKQIAQACGFAEVAFFSKVFHRLVGISPAAYRRGEVP